MSKVSRRRDRRRYSHEYRWATPNGRSFSYLMECRRVAMEHKRRWDDAGWPGFVVDIHTNPIQKRSKP